MAIDAVATSFIDECKARNRRTSTLLNYKSVFNGYILPRFGPREVGTLQKKELRAWFTQLLAEGCSAALVNRIIRAFKALLFYAMTELEVLDRNVHTIQTVRAWGRRWRSQSKSGRLHRGGSKSPTPALTPSRARSDRAPVFHRDPTCRGLCLCESATWILSEVRHASAAIGTGAGGCSLHPRQKRARERWRFQIGSSRSSPRISLRALAIQMLSSSPPETEHRWIIFYGAPGRS